MSLLCLDAGNTRLKWGLRAQSGWLAQGALAYEAIAALRTELPAAPRRIIACNVAGPAVAKQIESLAAALGVPLDWFRSSPAASGVTNGYVTPTQLGADRWAALIGARHHHTGPALVVLAGTATTIDVLSAESQFRGGLILPGLDLMRAALARNTAGLPEAQGRYCELPTNTDDAIVSGALQATLGAIERMRCRPMSPERGIPFGHADDFSVILSGGAADALAPHLSLPVRRIEHLVLEGLAASGVW